MTLNRSSEYLRSLLEELCSLPQETEWVEFKQDNDDPLMIGEYISALANSAALLGKQFGYVVWGVENDSHDVTGTAFKPSVTKHKQQELESWLLQKTKPRIHFRFFEFESITGRDVVILEIEAAKRDPVQFDGTEFIRVGSYKKKLRDFPAKERELWRAFDATPFEQQSAADNLTADAVLKLLDYAAYFDLMNIPLPENREGILSTLMNDQIIDKNEAGQWVITNLGAILFAKDLSNFNRLKRKAVRIVQYKGANRVETTREIEGVKGYAIGFDGLINYLKALLPANEQIKNALRKEVPVYPELAIRELVANALIHQDFSITGTGPLIEVFDTRLEITNPGAPLVAPERFLDSPPRSRNEALASLMRRIGFCEERGSGIDKVIFETEFYQLPAPIFESFEQNTRTMLFAYRAFKDMTKEERLRACYFHCALRYLSRQPMTNATLRERFGIEARNASMISRLLTQALENNVIKPYDETVGKKAMSYVPMWA
ncbi:transcriptional regulator [Aliidiomarina halalkaliphila]|uniref:Transcriptional regulator n=1 Tax=Aliidiomarina halalkaliphila TaxID=2593535 RepID=A0A552WZ11_9GAMM|nr:RNA-binding domain-containing protein [Aliidiomarina halalkaliphila]TRW48062.1 transcriptional regulator [Aliidiomarina halalkaliphila]